ncbi:MAG: hypothetical protein RBS33_11340 [Lentimicrobium sp.]|nr:hypothetical protein [Lentimicrobium sp.]
MSQKPLSISKNTILKAAEDFYRLRREGIGYIEQMGSEQWTDYNTHDPGITILEALCYAITDLAYRTGKGIKDILATAVPPADKLNPYPDQAFFTARDILTVNPWTTDDFRRLLIDAEGIRNAWLICKECACDLQYFAWCDGDNLVLSYDRPANPQIQPLEVSPRGLYEVLLELEGDAESGDLNTRKIEYTFSIFDGDGKAHPTVMEIRFPDWEAENKAKWALFLESNDAFNEANGASFNLSLLQFGATEGYNVITDPLLDEEGKNNYLRRHWRNLFYADFEIEILPGGEKITIEGATIWFLGDTTAKNGSTTARIAEILIEKEPSGIIQQYRNKAIKAESLVEASKVLLHSHRNLDEDFCNIQVVGIEEVSACADIEVAPDADIERIQAEIWFLIEQYFNPPVPFYSLQELMNENIPVEDIFNGPELNSGFIKASDLEKANLKGMLRTSDIINLLMEIDGVVAVNNLLLSKYDTLGNIVKGAADPVWLDGNPIFDASKTSAEWLLFIKANHQPRLYHNLSRFLFFKNGLPFVPRMDEAYDTLTQLQGEAERPKFKNAPNDLVPPTGNYSRLEDYFPVQYSLPLTYGVGPEGLPSHVSDARRAQAKQLKAYLLVYEQLLGNAFAQLAHTGELFSLDPATDRTYFVKEFSEELIRGYDEITNGLTTTGLEGMAETLNEFRERRNRFLNHLMSRFGEQFSEYALLLNNLQGTAVAAERLIENKTAFIKAYPTISHDRGKAFNYRKDFCDSENQAGLMKRVSLLLGFPDLKFSFAAEVSGSTTFGVNFDLTDSFGRTLLIGNTIVEAADARAAENIARKMILRQMIQPAAYEIATSAGKYTLKLKDKNRSLLATLSAAFDSKQEAQAMMDELVGWSSNERAIVAEHLLLRPKFPGDALYPACSDGSCATCGDEDPYSFRLSLVMPAWAGAFTTNLDMRRFADKTIQQEIPSHLLGKICWVGNDGFVENLCDPLITKITGLLMEKGLTEGGIRPTEAEACDCANAVYVLFSETFRNWYEDKTLLYIHHYVLENAIEAEFSGLDAGSSCTAIANSALMDEIRAEMVIHFVETAINGWQFERFEEAWCTWLIENSAIDWTKEKLSERVEAMLKARLMLQTATSDLCNCAKNILTKTGIAFYDWMELQIASGVAMADLPEFQAPAVNLCPGSTFEPGTAETIREFLTERYNDCKKASYSLRVVVNLLSKLRNVYPGATLHDCDDGSDQNPVRLGSTSLGNYPMKRSLQANETENISGLSHKAKKTSAKAKPKKSSKTSKKRKPKNPPQS